MKAKRILAGACATFMLAMTATPIVSAAEAVTVTIGNAKAEAGAKFSVTVDLADIPATGINACDFGIKYDSTALTITSVTAGELAKEDGAALEGVKALETGIDDGFVSVIYGLGEVGSTITGSGTFLTLEGTVSNTATAGKYALELVAVDRLAGTSGTEANADIIFGNLADDNTTYTLYTPTVTNGWIEVTSATTEPSTTPSYEGEVLIGDVDLSETVDFADATALSKYLLNKATYPLGSGTAETIAKATAQADVTKDGKVDSLDSAKLIEYNLKAITNL